MLKLDGVGIEGNIGFIRRSERSSCGSTNVKNAATLLL